MWHIIITRIDRYESGRKHTYQTECTFQGCIDHLEKYWDSISVPFDYCDCKNGEHITFIETDDVELTNKSIVKQKIKYTSYCNFAVINQLQC